MKRILVLTETDPLDAPEQMAWGEFDAVVLAFWAGPEFVEVLRGYGARDCVRLDEIVMDYAAAVARAFAHAHGLADRMPPYRGVNPWRAWENVIANALLVPQVAQLIHGALAARVGTAAEICFLGAGDMQRAFEVVNAHAAPCFGTRILGAPSTRTRTRGRLAAWWALAGEARLDRDFWNLVAVPLETVDANYALRARVRLPARATRGGTLCYSSYVNFSRVLAKHAGAFGEPVRWVVNSHSARRGLPRTVRAWDLWQFGGPAPQEHGGALARQAEVLGALPEMVEGLPLRALAAGSSVVQETAGRVMPRLLAEIDLMGGVLDALEPEAVWVANQWGGEGCLVQAAQARGMRVTQVQHGVLEPYFGCAPLYSDRFLVWSEFWRGLIAEGARERVAVDARGLEPGGAARGREAGGKRVTFFTSPPEISPFWNPAVAAWEVMALLNRLAKGGYAVTLRAHPMDRVGRYRALAEAGAAVEWDKGMPLGERLAQTDVGVMMFSTTFLECVARGIPVVGLGWYDFMWRKAVQAAGFIEYEDSLAAVEARVGGGGE